MPSSYPPAERNAYHRAYYARNRRKLRAYQRTYMAGWRDDRQSLALAVRAAGASGLIERK